MKFIKGVIRFFMGLCVAAVAAAFVLFDLTYIYDFLIQTAIPEIELLPYMIGSDWVRMILGGVIFVLALWAITPSITLRARKRTITFAGMHGQNVFELDSLEKGLSKALKSLPEVKQINELSVVTDNGGRRLTVSGEVVLKQTGLEGAQNAANRVSDFIASSAGGILGVEKEMITVNLNVSAILIDPKALADALMNPKPEPKLLPEQTYAPPLQQQYAPQPQQAYAPQPQQAPVYAPPAAAPGPAFQSVPEYAAPQRVAPEEPVSSIQGGNDSAPSNNDSWTDDDTKSANGDGADSSSKGQSEAF